MPRAVRALPQNGSTYLEYVARHRSKQARPGAGARLSPRSPRRELDVHGRGPDEHAPGRPSGPVRLLELASGPPTAPRRLRRCLARRQGLTHRWQVQHHGLHRWRKSQERPHPSQHSPTSSRSSAAGRPHVQVRGAKKPTGSQRSSVGLATGSPGPCSGDRSRSAPDPSH